MAVRHLRLTDACAELGLGPEPVLDLMPMFTATSEIELVGAGSDLVVI
jgi:hypothetical protein